MDQQEIPVVIEEHFKNDLRTTWNAISSHKEMVHWYFDNIPDFEAVKGFQTSFPVQSEERTFTHQWEIMEVVPYNLIKYEWTYKEYPGRAEVCFELGEDADGTWLRLSFTGLHTFPLDIQEFKPDSCRAGWEFFLGERLRAYLEQKT